MLFFIVQYTGQSKVSHVESILMNRGMKEKILLASSIFFLFILTVVNTRGDLEAKIDSEAVYEEPGELLGQ